MLFGLFKHAFRLGYSWTDLGFLILSGLNLFRYGLVENLGLTLIGFILEQKV